MENTQFIHQSDKATYHINTNVVKHGTSIGAKYAAFAKNLSLIKNQQPPYQQPPYQQPPYKQPPYKHSPYKHSGHQHNDVKFFPKDVEVSNLLGRNNLPKDVEISNLLGRNNYNAGDKIEVTPDAPIVNKNNITHNIESEKIKEEGEESENQGNQGENEGEKKANSTYFIIAAVLILVTIAAAAYYFIGQNQSNTQNTNTASSLNLLNANNGITLG